MSYEEKMLARKFIRFLKSKNAYVDYKLTFSGDFHRLLKRGVTCPPILIMDAFTWSKSRKGSDFWCDIYNLWCKINK